VKRNSLILLIAFLIGIQNTCPYGLAGKTGFSNMAEGEIQHCPYHGHKGANPEGTDHIKRDFSNSGQAFLLEASEPVLSEEHLLLREPVLLALDRFEDISPDRLLRPPADYFTS